MAREKNFGRGKYQPPPPDGGEQAHRPDYANELVTPTEHAVKLFEKFVRDWTPPAVPAAVIDQAVSGVRRAIRNIMPIDDHRKVDGHAVFKVQLGSNYDLEYVCVSPVFDKLKWAQNSCAEFKKRQPGEYVVCDVRTNQNVERER